MVRVKVTKLLGDKGLLFVTGSSKVKAAVTNAQALLPL